MVISTGYVDGAAAGMALPAHLYCLWGEMSTQTVSYPSHIHVQMHVFIHPFPHRHLWSFSSQGNNNARVLAETIWWEKNTVIYSCSVLVYLHFHKDISMIQFHNNSVVPSMLCMFLMLFTELFYLLVLTSPWFVKHKSYLMYVRVCVFLARWICMLVHCLYSLLCNGISTWL